MLKFVSFLYTADRKYYKTFYKDIQPHHILFKPVKRFAPAVNFVSVSKHKVTILVQFLAPLVYISPLTEKAIASRNSYTGAQLHVSIWLNYALQILFPC